MTPTLIWLACVTAAWTPASGQVDGYHTSLDGFTGTDVFTNQASVCVLDKYEEHQYRVQAFTSDGTTGPWSNPLALARVHSFDADGNGAAGYGDFGLLVQSFGCAYRAGGVAECP